MIKNKILTIFSICFLTFAMARYSVDINWIGITKANLGNDDGDAFIDGGSTLDTLGLKFTASVDNVTGTIGFDGNNFAFDYATLTVADLLDGMLSMSFYDVGWTAGKDKAARGGIGGVHGVSVTVKPIDLLSVKLIYGIRNDDTLNTSTGIGYFDTTAQGAFSLTNGTVVTPSVATGAGLSGTAGNVHGIALDVGVNLDMLPFTIYAGALLFDRPMQMLLTTSTGQMTYLESTRVANISAGLSADLLAALSPGLLKLDLGASFAGTANNDYILTAEKILGATSAADAATNTAETDINLIAILSGSTSFMDDAFGLAYYAHYSLDTPSKHTALGDATDDFFGQMIKVTVTPSYKLGNFTLALGLGFDRFGEAYSSQYKGYSKKKLSEITAQIGAGENLKDNAIAYNALNVDPSITWNVANGMSVKFWYEMDMILGGSDIYAGGSEENLSDAGDAIDHVLGMTTSIAFGVSSEE